MRALISADMEGATGVTAPDDCIPGKTAYARFQPLFTGDVNAVALGFFDAGVDEVVVTEAHGGMRHLLIEQLDPRISMISGKNRVFAMLEGIQDRPDLVAFVGYHGAAGTEGILSHTFMASPLTGVTLNGRVMSEGYLNALLASEYGAKLALVSGDDITCHDAAGYAPHSRQVPVKFAVDRYTARCLSPETTSGLLREAAAASVDSCTLAPLPEPPFECVATFGVSNSAMAAALVPGVDRVDDRSVAFTFGTIAELYHCYHVVITMASLASEPGYG
ncbi:MAG TPA: M55 family metallopeptidase [Nakamurella sp.]|jgi:D-amino peptidase|nr:M55 family metallopeptidase [Nakamurella sp.]